MWVDCHVVYSNEKDVESQWCGFVSLAFIFAMYTLSFVCFPYLLQTPQSYGCSAILCKDTTIYVVQVMCKLRNIFCVG